MVRTPAAPHLRHQNVLVEAPIRIRLRPLEEIGDGHWDVGLLTCSNDDEDSSGLSMVINGYQWLLIVINGYSWLSMVINGYSWLSMVIHGYSWLSMVFNGY